ncbi:MAG: hypothetical protein AABX17_01035 [Nanoarchaeota archaeon]
MDCEFDDYAKRILGYFQTEGYKIVSTTFQTVSIKDAKEKPINAYTEPYVAELSKDNVEVRIEFNLVHERESKKRKIKAIAIRPESLQLQDILKSEKHLAEIFADR